MCSKLNRVSGAAVFPHAKGVDLRHLFVAFPYFLIIHKIKYRLYSIGHEIHYIYILFPTTGVVDAAPSINGGFKVVNVVAGLSVATVSVVFSIDSISSTLLSASSFVLSTCCSSSSTRSPFVPSCFSLIRTPSISSFDEILRPELRLDATKIGIQLI